MVAYEYDPDWTTLGELAADVLDAADQWDIGGYPSLPSSCFVGVSTHSAGMPRCTALDAASELLRQAELAAELAVKRGDARYCVYSEHYDELFRKAIMLDQQLRGAIARNEFLLHYQPIINLDSFEPVAYEALVRWQGPGGRLRFPAEFIPAAEDTGLISQIGSTVVDLAVQQLRRWLDDGWSPGKVAVNVSAPQLMERGFPALVSSSLERAAVDPALFELEVTERTLIGEPALARDILLDLRSRGIGVALDDFGVGYSSLKYLRDLPVTKLKIDRSFIANVGTDSRDAALVRAVIKLGDSLGLDVIAEGIETDVQLSALQDCGCSFGQGYLLGAPQPPGQFGPVGDAPHDMFIAQAADAVR